MVQSQEPKGLRIQKNYTIISKRIKKTLEVKYKLSIEFNIQHHGRALWSSGQSLCLLIMRFRVQFPVLPWEFSLKGRIREVTMVWVG